MSTPEKFIGCTLTVQLNDERSLNGVLTVIDPFGNMLLSNVRETSRDKLNSSLVHTRELGLVSIPKEAVVKVEMTRAQYEKNVNPK